MGATFPLKLSSLHHLLRLLILKLPSLRPLRNSFIRLSNFNPTPSYLPRSSKRSSSKTVSSFSIIALFLIFAFCLTIYQNQAQGPTSLTDLENARAENQVANIAFFIQIYSKTIDLLPPLIDVIWHPDNIYAVHVDADVPDERMEAVDVILANPKYSNVLLMPREHVTYLGITTLLSTLDAITFLLNQSTEWKYFINLSGADYPMIKPNHIRELLGSREIAGNRLNFVQAYDDPSVVRDQIYKSRFETMWVDSALWMNIALHKGEERQSERCKHGCLLKSDASAHPLLDHRFGELPIVKTEAWVILHRSFAEYAVESPMSRRLQATLCNMACPEEFFFGTLLELAGEFSGSIVYDAFRCVLWTHKRYKGSRPPELDSGVVANVTGILEESGAMFSRKMMKRESTVKAFVEHELLGLWDGGNEVRAGMSRSERYVERVRRRVRCMVGLRWKWRSHFHRYANCMQGREQW